jgi:hypothetical protein
MKSCLILPVFLLAVQGSTARPLPQNEPAKPGISAARPANSVFNLVHAHRQGRAITVFWSTDATPQSVTHFVVEKTDQVPTDPASVWEQLTTTGNSGGRMFRIQDNNLVPGSLNYRVIAYNGIDPVEVSNVCSVRTGVR